MSFLDTIQNVWLEEEVELLEKCFNLKLTDIHKQFLLKGFDRSIKAIAKKRSKLRKKEADTAQVAGNKAIVIDDDPVETLYQTYDKEVGKKITTESKITQSHSNIHKSDSKIQKYLHLCDLHIPFHIKKLEDIVIKEANKDTILILNGDLMDCYDVSVFPKAHSVGLKNEVAIFKDFLKKWSHLFKSIYITQGNHDFRVSSFLRKKISSDVISLIPDDIIEIVLNDLKIDNIYYAKGDRNNWYIQVDNAIFAHPIDFKSGILGTALMVMNYFDARNTNANIFISAHSHAFGKSMYKGRVLVEGGCCCEEPDYSSSGKLSYIPQVNGYLKITSINNNIDFNNIELVKI